MIKFLVMDVDGTLTDGKIYMGPSGEAFKAFDIKDGCGIKDILPRYGIIPVIVTARESVMLENRCKELEIENLYQGVRHKLEKLNEILDIYSKEDGIDYSLKDCAYIGDDILDLQCMEPIKNEGGIVGCPADAVPEVKAVADFISNSKGGNGAVREFINYLVGKRDDGCLEDKINKAIDYISNLDIHNAAVGTYEIDRDSYYMVQEYCTKQRIDCKLESHKKYVDIQWIVKGREEIDTASVIGLEILEDYNSEKDAMFWKIPDNMQRNVLGENSYVVLYPHDGHMPCIAVGKTEKIKKIVVKVKI